jgi:hypothetical protein
MECRATVSQSSPCISRSPHLSPRRRYLSSLVSGALLSCLIYPLHFHAQRTQPNPTPPSSATRLVRIDLRMSQSLDRPRSSTSPHSPPFLLTSPALPAREPRITPFRSGRRPRSCPGDSSPPGLTRACCARKRVGALAFGWARQLYSWGRLFSGRGAVRAPLPRPERPSVAMWCGWPRSSSPPPPAAKDHFRRTQLPPHPRRPSRTRTPYTGPPFPHPRKGPGRARRAHSPAGAHAHRSRASSHVRAHFFMSLPASTAERRKAEANENTFALRPALEQRCVRRGTWGCCPGCRALTPPPPIHSPPSPPQLPGRGGPGHHQGGAEGEAAGRQVRPGEHEGRCGHDQEPAEG